VVLLAVGFLSSKKKRPPCKLFLEKAGSFGEGPRWHAGKLYFSDFYGHEVRSVTLQGKCETAARVDDAEKLKADIDCHGPSGTGFMPDGSMLIVEMRGRRILRVPPGGGEPVEHASMKQYIDFQANDMVVDEQGACYVGNFGFDLKADFEDLKTDAEKLKALEKGFPSTHLIRVTPDGQSSPCTPKDVIFPNGIVITPSGDQLIVAETFANKISAYPRNKDGTLGEKRLWADLKGCFPDGMCLDAEGCIWVGLVGMMPQNVAINPVSALACLVTTGKCSAFARVKEGGEILQLIPTCDGYGAVACMLGGDDGTTLFMLESQTTDPVAIEEMRSKQTISENCKIWTIQVDVGAAVSPTAPHYCAGYC